jgi:hypothetical protein
MVHISVGHLRGADKFVATRGDTEGARHVDAMEHSHLRARNLRGAPPRFPVRWDVVPCSDGMDPWRRTVPHALLEGRPRNARTGGTHDRDKRNASPALSVS